MGFERLTGFSSGVRDVFNYCGKKLNSIVGWFMPFGIYHDVKKIDFDALKLEVKKEEDSFGSEEKLEEIVSKAEFHKNDNALCLELSRLISIVAATGGYALYEKVMHNFNYSNNESEASNYLIALACGYVLGTGIGVLGKFLWKYTIKSDLKNALDNSKDSIVCGESEDYECYLPAENEYTPDPSFSEFEPEVTDDVCEISSEPEKDGAPNQDNKTPLRFEWDKFIEDFNKYNL